MNHKNKRNKLFILHSNVYFIGLILLILFTFSIDRLVYAAQPKKYSEHPKVNFELPAPQWPFYHAKIMFPSKSIPDIKLLKLMINGTEERDYIVFNEGIESYKKMVQSDKEVLIVTRCDWERNESVEFELEGIDATEKPIRLKFKGKAPLQSGYWDKAWPRYYSFVVDETRGIDRTSEPIHVTFGIFADEIADPVREIRVITYEPDHPGTDPNGYVSIPYQIIQTTSWNNQKVLSIEEKDQKTGKTIHRYDPTMTVELLFLADVKANESKVFLVFFGNPQAIAPTCDFDLKVTAAAPGQKIENSWYRFGLSQNSGAIETVVLKADKDYLFEHKLETNGAVHWNPGIYAPPMPWVHASDWEHPDFKQISGRILHRTQRYAPLPHMKNVKVNISYSFYANVPYMLVSSVMVVEENLFVKALRNCEIVFNHAILNEFVWEDPKGDVQSLPIEPSRPHPEHAIEIPPDTPWMAFINRKEKVGFAGINIASENGNLYGAPPSLAQPYIYVANGPWIYWSRAFVYPFGDHALTRMMPVRKGSFYIERNAYLPFKFNDGDDPFAEVKKMTARLKNPLKVRHWVPTGQRTPREWIMPILTAPFDEGVEGAVGKHTKDIEEKQK